MENVNPLKIIVVLGPTASGKSSLAIKLAKKFNGEVISADSRQVYRGMDIGTGKVSKDKGLKTKAKTYPGPRHLTSDIRRYAEFYSDGIRHHLLDVASPKKQFSVDDFVRMGKKAIEDIANRGKLPIVCGGTGLYIDSLIFNIAIPHVPPDKKLRANLERLSVAELYARLKKLDPKRAETVDRHNPRRLIRALEIILLTGKPVPEISTDYAKMNAQYDVLWLGLNPGRELLAKRIEKRLDERLRQGMVREIQKLHKDGVSWKRLEAFGLEYKWLARYLQSKDKRLKTNIKPFSPGPSALDYRTMRKNLLTDIIRYSKRQMTWFNRNKKTHWVERYREATALIFSFIK